MVGTVSWAISAGLGDDEIYVPEQTQERNGKRKSSSSMLIKYNHEANIPVPSAEQV